MKVPSTPYTDSDTTSAEALDPVNEETPDIEYAPLRDEDSNTRQGPRYRSGSHGVTSQYSVATGFTTHSQEDIQSMDAELILDSLEDLNNATDRILGLVAPSSASQDTLSNNAAELLKVRSTLKTRLNAHMAAFQGYKANFAQQQFIDAEHVLRFLLQLPPQADLRSSIWRPDDILYKANLINVLILLLQELAEQDWIDLLSSIDMQVPGLALSSMLEWKSFSGLVGQSREITAALDFALEVRTQMLIGALKVADDTQDPLEFLHLAYLASEDQNPAIFSDNGEDLLLRRWNPPMFGNDNSDLWAVVADRYETIRGLIEESEDVDGLLVALETEYPKAEFISKLLRWTQKRGDELCTLIAERGGLSTIVRTLAEEVRKVRSPGIGVEGEDKPVDPPRCVSRAASSLWHVTDSAYSMVSTANINKLKDRKKRQKLSAVEATAAGTEPPVPAPGSPEPAPPVGGPAPTDDHVPQFDNDDEIHVAEDVTPDTSLPADPSDKRAQAARLLRPIRERQSQANKENVVSSRFIDAQADAHRVTFEDSQDSPQRPPASSNVIPLSSASRTGTKRPYTEDDGDGEDPDWQVTQDDEAFQTDTRVHSVPQRTRAPTARMVSSAAEPSTASSSSATPRPAPATTQTKRERQNPGQAIDPLPAPRMTDAGIPETTTQYDRWRMANLTARQAIPEEPKPMQYRKAWTREETTAVMDYIATHGAQYALIKRYDEGSGGNLLQRRGAEDIRFKARNLKVDFLK